MVTKNKYEDMNVSDVLEYVNNHTMLLPDIQREYVWDYGEIEKLFESIVDGYPIGSCIFWKTTRSNLNREKPNLYYFLREFKEGTSKNEKAPEIFRKEKDYYIVLDGQQRITSLNIALCGSYTSYKGGRGHAKDDPNSWITRELYYNLEYYKNKSDQEDDEHPEKRFRFLSKEESTMGKWYKVNRLLGYDDLSNAFKDWISAEYTDDICQDLTTLFQRLQMPSDALVHYYCISENNYDDALDIFVRVNSTGRKLAKSDLLFSTLIDGWKEGKDNIEKLLKTMNSKGDGFNFTRDYLMRLALVLVDANTNLKIQSLTKKTIIAIRENWDSINKSLETMATLLVAIGLSKETLTSYNATMPIAYYLYRGGKIEDANSKREMKKFLSVAMAKRLFGIASNSALNNTRNTLKSLNCKETPFKLSMFSNVVLTGGRNFRVTKNDVDYWLEHYEKGQNTYVLLSLLYPDLKLSQVAFHQDHCHPYSGFDHKKIKKLSLSDVKEKDWRKKRNLLPNLQFLSGSDNESKNDTPLKIWVKKGGTFAYHPKGVSLELKDFDLFFEARRLLMKKELFRLFDLTYTREDEEIDKRRISSLD